jgi:nitroreductase
MTILKTFAELAGARQLLALSKKKRNYVAVCLKAGDLGLGTCMVGWFNEKKVKQLLDIPSSKRVPLLITVGYRSGEIRKKIRKKLSDIYSVDKY